jgi:hypothetical protein
MKLLAAGLWKEDLMLNISVICLPKRSCIRSCHLNDAIDNDGVAAHYNNGNLFT